MSDGLSRGSKYAYCNEVDIRKINPTKWMVLVRQDKKSLVRPSGLWVPDMGRNSIKSSINKKGEMYVGSGVVLKMGDDCRTELKVGDRVYFGNYRGITSFATNNENYIIFKEIDLLAIIPKDADVI